MILSEIRASAYRIAAAVFGVLAVALLVVAMFLWGRLGAARADAAEQGEKARAAELRAEALSQAMARDAVSDAFTAQAEQRMDAQAAAISSRLSAIEGRLHDRPPVPAVCPDPDADLVRESAEGADRIRAAAGRLRSLRAAEGGNPE